MFHLTLGQDEMRVWRWADVGFFVLNLNSSLKTPHLLPKPLWSNYVLNLTYVLFRNLARQQEIKLGGWWKDRFHSRHYIFATHTQRRMDQFLQCQVDYQYCSMETLMQFRKEEVSDFFFSTYFSLPPFQKQCCICLVQLKNSLSAVQCFYLLTLLMRIIKCLRFVKENH